ncbi:MAG TPA: hypothetical protein VGQ57_06695 [Polyangiaceae bacterium]|jgi:hypothetical protein|nr:hypothetical protein [Polyangiaceae bacterium]
MQWLRALGVLCLAGSFTASCTKGRDVKHADKEDKLAFDESGKGRKCDTPKSSCDEVKDPSLDFKEKCREAGFRMKQCGCDNLCSGNINGDRTGYTSKNQLKTCHGPGENCQEHETSAAYQDACDGVGGEMMECGCEWLCSKQLKEAIPDPAKEAEKPADDATGDDKKADQKKADEKPHGNMDGKAPPPPPPAKDKSSSSKDKASKDKASKEKTTKENSSSDSSGEKKKERFHLPD